MILNTKARLPSALPSCTKILTWTARWRGDGKLPSPSFTSESLDVNRCFTVLVRTSENGDGRYPYVLVWAMKTETVYWIRYVLVWFPWKQRREHKWMHRRKRRRKELYRFLFSSSRLFCFCGACATWLRSVNRVLTEVCKLCNGRMNSLCLSVCPSLVQTKLISLSVALVTNFYRLKRLS